MTTKTSTCGSTQTQSGQPCRIHTAPGERCRYHKTTSEVASSSGADEIEKLMAELQSEFDLLMETERESRSRIQKLGERLQEVARDAHVHANTADFTLEDDPHGVQGLYGHLYVSPRTFGLATRSQLADIEWSMYDFDWGEPSYNVTTLSDWPVDWVRIVTRSERMRELTKNLIKSIKNERENPLALQAIPHHMVFPPTPITEIAETLNFSKVVRDWRDAQSFLTHKPASAVRAAMVLVETVCKHILDANGVEIEDHQVSRLLKQVIKSLGLDRSKTKQVLGGISSIVNGIRDPRNNSSDAHGSGPNQEAIDPLEAQLVVQTAGQISVFLMEKLRISQVGKPVDLRVNKTD